MTTPERDVAALVANIRALHQPFPEGSGGDGPCLADGSAWPCDAEYAARLLSSPDPVAGDGLATWARWIVQQTRRTDWACRECVDADVRGQDYFVIAGFRCVWHEATAALAAPLSSPVAGDGLREALVDLRGRFKGISLEPGPDFAWVDGHRPFIAAALEVIDDWADRFLDAASLSSPVDRDAEIERIAAVLHETRTGCFINDACAQIKDIHSIGAAALYDAALAKAHAGKVPLYTSRPGLDGARLLTIFREERDCVPRGPANYWSGYRDGLETAMRRVETEVAALLPTQASDSKEKT